MLRQKKVKTTEASAETMAVCLFIVSHIQWFVNATTEF